jgi:hypothetical protein
MDLVDSDVGRPEAGFLGQGAGVAGRPYPARGPQS